VWIVRRKVWTFWWHVTVHDAYGGARPAAVSAQDACVKALCEFDWIMVDSGSPAPGYQRTLRKSLES
jgi:hypothetical protein